MENKYIINDDEIVGVEGEEFIREEEFNFNGNYLKVLITKEKEYYNFYIITDIFKKEPLNNLDIQEPEEIYKELSEEEVLRFIEERAINYYLWFKYNRYYSILSEEIPI